ncbi:hypothetical protein [Tumebacillus lipolyticus]|uniref:Uncharacterized protein n=1 Tax=Tumebacillus lipolyticus TaxID=1280370 RepID=A0ABW5A1E6_9BACL
MNTEITIKLQGDNAPEWALGKQNYHYWYHENEHGEQWVAKREADMLHISGLDIGWQEVHLTLEDAKGERERIHNMLLISVIRQVPELRETVGASFVETAIARDRTLGKLPLAQWLLNTGELFWAASVLQAAIPMMEWAREKNNED